MIDALFLFLHFITLGRDFCHYLATRLAAQAAEAEPLAR